MKSLIINGSPKKDGDTEYLVNIFQEELKGDVKVVSCFDNIEPCNDCRYCWEDSGCAINDSMQDVYLYLEECDNIIIASPIWFSSLSGPTLNIVSRIQSIYAAKYFRKQDILLKEKKGAIVIVGAEPGTEVTPTKTALTMMKFMNVNRSTVRKAYSLETNTIPSKSDKKVIEEVIKISSWMNE